MNLKADETAVAKGLAKAGERVRDFGALLLPQLRPVAEQFRDVLAPVVRELRRIQENPPPEAAARE